MKNIEDIEYLEHAQFNMTKMIRHAYEAGTPLTKEQLAYIDFNEEANKVIYLPVNASYGKQNRHDIKETLATNISALLPLEYYKEYIQPSWIISHDYSNYGIVDRALTDNNYEFLHELLSVCKKNVSGLNKKNEKDRKFLGSYENSLLSPILNISGNLEQLGNLKATQETYNNYLKLFKVALVDFKNYFEDQSKQLYADIFDAKPIDAVKKAPGDKDNPLVFDDKLWHVEYRKMSSMFRNFTRQEEVLNTLVDDPKAFPVYLDVFAQYKDRENNPFSDFSVLYSALETTNKKVVTHLCEQKVFSPSELDEAFNKVIKSWVYRQKDKEHKGYDNQLGDCSAYIKKICEIVQKSNPKQEILDYESFSNVLPACNSKLVEDIINKYPRLLEEKLEHGLTLTQWDYAKKLFHEFIKDNDFHIRQTGEGCNYISYNFYYMERVTENVEPPRKITPDEKMAVNEIIAQYFLPLLEIDIEMTSTELTTKFYTYTLNKQLEEKPEDKKKLKI